MTVQSTEHARAAEHESWARAALERAAGAGATYADVRIVEERARDLGVRFGNVSRLEQAESLGAGVRVVAGGAWGFAAAPDPSATGIADLCDQAIREARAGGGARQQPVRLAGLPPQRGFFRSPRHEDPFDVGLEEQFDLLMRIDAVLRRAPEVRSTQAAMSFLGEHQWLYTSDGTAVEQDTLRSGGGFSATAIRDGVVQTRSHPASLGGQFLQGGYEVVREMELLAHAERVRDEAVELLGAPLCPGGEFDLILGGSQLALQIHESVGHPNEFDRVLGFEVDLAGGSFVTPDKRGSFRYGSEVVHLVADSTLPGGLATFGWDDDGVPAQRWHVVENGVHQNYFTNREFALRLGDTASLGANRAWGWRYAPQIRIPNLSLMPGEGSLDDLIADTGRGFFLDTVKTWSIDQMRLNFQFTTEVAREIRNGRLGRLYRDPTYQGITPAFWRSCDAIAGPEEWVAWGEVSCGKGQPMQVAEMSHGCAPARFRKTTFVGGGGAGGSA